MLGFRVWDVENKRFINENESSVVMSQQGEAIQLSPAHWMIAQHLMDGSQYIPMQSTGICDMFDKEIFEGDLLKILERKSIYLVEDRTSFSFFFSRSFGWNARMGRQSIMIKIIGNKYRNPELMEKIK